MKDGKTITIPGTIDLHVHLREPSANLAETISTGTRAALYGGITMVCDMPNNPNNPTWTMERLKDKHRIIKRSSFIPVATYAGSQPESDNLDELGEMSRESIGLKLYGAFTTGNDRDYRVEDFREIVAKWHEVAPKKPIMLHSGKGNLAEFIDLIAKKNSHPLHVCHLSTFEDAIVAARAKARGLPVTSAVCPHHLLLDYHDTLTQGWFARMMPPPLSEVKSTKLFDMFAKGKIDVLESDHAPHLPAAKWKAEAENPDGVHDPKKATCFGVPGVEFMVPLMLYQVERGRLSLKRLIDAVSSKPAEIIGVKISPRTTVTWKLHKYRIGDEKLQLSGSGWTPYLGMIAGAKISKVVISGHLIVDNGRVISRDSKVISQRGEML